MVHRNVCIFLSAAVLASVCLTPLTLRADSILSLPLADQLAYFVPNPIGVPMGEEVITIDNSLEFATEFEAVASEPEALELLGISLVLIVLVLRRRSMK